MCETPPMNMRVLNPLLAILLTACGTDKAPAQTDAAAVDTLRQSAEASSNDARWLRETHARERLLAEMVRQGAERFRGH